MESIHISLQAEIIGHFLGLPITNSFILSLLAGVILVGGGLLIARKLKPVPNKTQSTAELLIDGSLNVMTQILGEKKQALKFFPLIATLFFFILINNWMGVLPGIGSLGIFEEAHGLREFVPFLRPASADLNTTLALALIAVVTVQIYAIKKLGFGRQISKYFDFKHGPIHFFVGLLELVGEFARVISFSFRLFGNMFAGEVLLIIMLGILPLFVTFGALPFFFLEYFVGFIQALVFAMLTLVFLKVALIEEEAMAH